MNNADAFLEITFDLKDPVEINDFAAFFAGLGSEFERYLISERPELAGSARMFVNEVRKGSIVATMFASIPDLVGIADSALIVLGFGALFNRRIRDFIRGKHLEGANKPQLSDLTKAVQAIASDKDGTMAVKGLRLKN